MVQIRQCYNISPYPQSVSRVLSTSPRSRGRPIDADSAPAHRHAETVCTLAELGISRHGKPTVCYGP